MGWLRGVGNVRLSLSRSPSGADLQGKRCLLKNFGVSIFCHRWHLDTLTIWNVVRRSEGVQAGKVCAGEDDKGGRRMKVPLLPGLSCRHGLPVWKVSSHSVPYALFLETCTGAKWGYHQQTLTISERVTEEWSAGRLFENRIQTQANEVHLIKKWQRNASTFWPCLLIEFLSIMLKIRSAGFRLLLEDTSSMCLLLSESTGGHLPSDALEFSNIWQRLFETYFELPRTFSE
jgi:hypothetical protein